VDPESLSRDLGDTAVLESEEVKAFVSDVFVLNYRLTVAPDRRTLDACPSYRAGLVSLG